jgi:hypothetical protein
MLPPGVGPVALSARRGEVDRSGSRHASLADRAWASSRGRGRPDRRPQRFSRESRDCGRYLPPLGPTWCAVWPLCAARGRTARDASDRSCYPVQSAALPRARWANIASRTQPMVRGTAATPRRWPKLGEAAALGRVGGPARPNELPSELPNELRNEVMGAAARAAGRSICSTRHFATTRGCAATRGGAGPRTDRHGPAAVAGSVARCRSTARKCWRGRAAFASVGPKWPTREPTTVPARRRQRQMGASRGRLVAGSARYDAGHAAQHGTTIRQSPRRGRPQGSQQDARAARCPAPGGRATWLDPVDRRASVRRVNLRSSLTAGLAPYTGGGLADASTG